MLFLYSLLLGCNPPVKAPEDLEQLTTYIFEHMMAEDQRYVTAGMENLNTWLNANFEEAKNGYQVNNLTIEAVESLGIEVPEGLDDQIGVAVSYKMSYSIDKVVPALIEADPMEVSPGSYVSFSEERITELECFLEQTCDSFEAYHDSINALPLGIEIHTVTHNQYHWVPLEEEYAMVQRSWLTEKPTSNISWAELLAQFYFAATLPTENGTIRLASGWSLLRLGDIPIPEDLALSMAIDSLSNTGTNIENYLAAEN